MRPFLILIILLLMSVALAEDMESFADRHIGEKVNVSTTHGFYEGIIISSGDSLVLDDNRIIAWRIIEMIALEGST